MKGLIYQQRRRGLTRKSWLSLALILIFLAGVGELQPEVQAANTADLIIYADALAAGWADWSWDSTVEFDNPAPVQSGTDSVAITFQKAFAGFSVRAPAPINTTGYTGIAFWIYGGGGGTQLNLQTQPTDSGPPSTAYTFTAPAGSWTQVVVSFQALGNPTGLQRINLQDESGAAQPTFYLDGLRLVGSSAPSPDKWALWQNGTHLRGANMHQRRSYPDADGDLAQVGPVIPPYTQADFNKLAALGANYINISHPGLFTETPPYQLDPVIQNNLDHLLSMIAQAKLYAVISFRTGPGRNEFIFLEEESDGWLGYSKDINEVWTSGAAQDGWVAMWRYTAQRYRSHPVVVGYDLMVEPNSNKQLNIWEPQSFYPAYTNTLYDWNQLHRRLSTAIREVDTQTPILTGAMSYSAISWLAYLKPTTDTRTVYTVHQYEPFVYTHQTPPLTRSYPGTFDADGDNDNDTVNKAWLNSWLAPIDSFKTTYKVPVAVNEYGLMRWQPGGAQFMADSMALFEQRGLNHAWWLWAPADSRFTDYVHPFNLLLGPDPANRQEVSTSALLTVIRQNWSQNIYRPGNEQVFLPLLMKRK